MTTPIFLLGLLLATLYGTAFHFWRGGGLGRLVLYVVLSIAGFWAGHLLATAQTWNIFQLGALQLGGATVGSAFFLLVGHWLSKIQRKGKP